MRHVWLPLLALLAAPAAARADNFDHYTNDILALVPKKADAVQSVKELDAGLITDHAGVLKDSTAAFVVVKTNEGRYAKLLVQLARQKVPGGKKTVPILLIERFVTYREGEERTVVAQGQGVRLFADFQFNLDLGQVVPAAVGGDLHCAAVDGDKVVLRPVGKAELYLVTKSFPEAAPKKADKLVVGAAFEPRYFNGKYQLYDDGRRSGVLVLSVKDDKEVTGWYYSDKDGKKYEVDGKVGEPRHSLTFKITFPQTVQFFHGYLFTGDGRAITGSSRLQDRDTGFYALRLEK
jgi:hypothetical protein